MSCRIIPLPRSKPLPVNEDFVIVTKTRSGSYDVAIVKGASRKGLAFPRYRRVDGKDRAMELGAGLAQANGIDSVYVQSGD